MPTSKYLIPDTWYSIPFSYHKLLANQKPPEYSRSMLSKDDLVAIGQLIDQRLERQLDKRLEPITQDIKTIRQEMAGVQKDIVPISKDISILSQDLSVIQKDIVPISKDIKTFRQDMTKVQKDIRVMLAVLDRADVELRRRIERIEEHLDLPPLQ